MSETKDTPVEQPINGNEISVDSLNRMAGTINKLDNLTGNTTQISIDTPNDPVLLFNKDEKIVRTFIGKIIVPPKDGNNDNVYQSQTRKNWLAANELHTINDDIDLKDNRYYVEQQYLSVNQLKQILLQPNQKVKKKIVVASNVSQSNIYNRLDVPYVQIENSLDKVVAPISTSGKITFTLPAETVVQIFEKEIKNTTTNKVETRYEFYLNYPDCPIFYFQAIEDFNIDATVLNSNSTIKDTLIKNGQTFIRAKLVDSNFQYYLNQITIKENIINGIDIDPGIVSDNEIPVWVYVSDDIYPNIKTGDILTCAIHSYITGEDLSTKPQKKYTPSKYIKFVALDYRRTSVMKMGVVTDDYAGAYKDLEPDTFDIAMEISIQEAYIGFPAYVNTVYGLGYNISGGFDTCLILKSFKKDNYSGGKMYNIPYIKAGDIIFYTKCLYWRFIRDGNNIEIVWNIVNIAIKYPEVSYPRMFFAKIKDVIKIKENQYKYKFDEVGKTTAPGYGNNWKTEPSDTNFINDKWAYNLCENWNGAAGLQGNGIDINIPGAPVVEAGRPDLTGFGISGTPLGVNITIQPCCSVIVIMYEIINDWNNGEPVYEYWFQYENSVAGKCP